MPEAEPLTPARAPGRLCEMSVDARAAVLLDGAGELEASSGVDGESAEALASLAGELLEAVDGAVPGDPPEEVEAQVERGIVYAVRHPQWTLATVAPRAALSSLMLYDLRAVLGELER